MRSFIPMVGFIIIILNQNKRLLSDFELVMLVLDYLDVNVREKSRAIRVPNLFFSL